MILLWIIHVEAQPVIVIISVCKKLMASPLMMYLGICIHYLTVGEGNSEIVSVFYQFINLSIVARQTFGETVFLLFFFQAAYYRLYI